MVRATCLAVRAPLSRAILGSSKECVGESAFGLMGTMRAKSPQRWKGELAAQASGIRPSRADSHPQGGQRKKVVSLSARRRAVKMSVLEGLGKVAAACRALGLARSSYYRSGRSRPGEAAQPQGSVPELSAKHPRYGYRRITATLYQGVRCPHSMRLLTSLTHSPVPPLCPRVKRLT